MPDGNVLSGMRGCSTAACRMCSSCGQRLGDVVELIEPRGVCRGGALRAAAMSGLWRGVPLPAVMLQPAWAFKRHHQHAELAIDAATHHTTRLGGAGQQAEATRPCDNEDGSSLQFKTRGKEKGACRRSLL